MYRVMLVDDEQIILDGLRGIIDWESCGFTVAGAFSRASEALRAAPGLRPDLIITDIEMPGENGLHLIGRLKAVLPDARFVILSAHDRFTYAQDAIRQGAQGYLLKPIDKGELVDMLRDLASALDERARRRGDMAAHVLARVLCDGADGCSPAERAAADAVIKDGCRLVYVSPRRMLADCETYEPATPPQEFVRRIRLRLGSMMPFYRDGVWIFPVKSDRPPAGAADEFPDAAYAFGRPFESLHGACEQCTQELDSFMNARFIQASGMLRDRSASSADEPQPLPPAELAERLHAALDAGDAAIAEECADTAQQELSGCAWLTRPVELAYLEALFPARRYATGRRLWFDDMENLADMLELLRGFIMRILRERAKGQLSGAQLVGRVRLYLDEHFARPDLRMSDVADMFYINYSYLSTIFKKETGVNFNQYLLARRIEEAKKLLENTRMPAAEIAHMVGYADAKYFFHAFKRYTGQSPGRYQRQALRERK